MYSKIAAGWKSTSVLKTYTCFPVPCPEHSTGRHGVPSGCSCDPGHSGTITASSTGQFFEGVCAPCSVGRQQSLAGQPDCIDCPVGRRQPNTTALGCTNCTK